jgi:hypothetical protein
MSWRRAARQRRAMRRDFGAGCTLKLCARTCRRLWMRRRASCRYTDRFTHKNVNVVFRKKKNNGWLREQAHTTNTPLVAANYNRQNRTDKPLEMGGEKGDRAACGEMGDRGGGLLRVGEGGSPPRPKGPCGCRRRREGSRVVSVAWVPYPELVPGGPRLSCEVGGVHRAEVPGVGGVLRAACRRPCGLTYVYDMLTFYGFSRAGPNL